MNRYFYTISPEQLDRGGLATVPAIYRILIDSISRNIRTEGFGVDVLQRRGMTWALARCAVEFFRRPGLYDEICVEVWRGEGSGLCHNRCVRATAGDGSLVCCGVTDWCVIDLMSRRPQAPLSRENDGNEAPCAPPRRLKPIPSLACAHHTLEVGYSECDFNGHLNNAKYVETFYDMLPDSVAESLSRFRIDINFRRELPCGSVARACVAPNGSSGYDYCLYTEGLPACCASISRL